jgi:excisionase family DNA binding protein
MAATKGETKAPNKTPDYLRDVEASLAPLNTIPEVCKITRLGDSTLRQAIKRGEMRTLRRAPTGSSRVLIPRSEVIRYLTEREAA